VHLLETGQLVVTDGEGRFRFDRLRPGSYTVAARGPDGKESKAELTIPGQGVEITLGAAPKAAAKR
jgi:protocatechuate 3,4-dioxygenase beta subunit